MSWVALDRGVLLSRDFGFKGPVEEWERERDAVKEDVLDQGFDRDRGTFTQVYGEPQLDAALLEIPIVGFLDGDDERVTGTIDAVRADLAQGDLLYRYRSDDTLEGDEGAFLPCSFWLVQALALNGRFDEACELFEGLCRRSTPLGLLPEEIQPDTGMFLGNYPQGLTHIALLNAAATLRKVEDRS